MKSLKFSKLNLSDADILTRLEMKSVTGGYSCWCYHNAHQGSGPDPDGCETECESEDIEACCGSDYDGMNCY